MIVELFPAKPGDDRLADAALPTPHEA